MKRALLFYGLVFIVLLTFIPGFARLQELKVKNRALNKEIRALKQENLVLQKEVGKLQTDSVYLESIAREKMGVVKKGEVIYHIVPEEKKE